MKKKPANPSETGKTSMRLNRTPPMFGENFREMGAEWKQISEIDFDLTGRVLVCHLIIEHYITTYLEFTTPEELCWDDSRLTFSQKTKLLKKAHVFENNQFIKGIEIINRVRNRFSHNLLASIDSGDIGELSKILQEYYKDEPDFDPLKYETTPIDVIEFFTGIVCAYIGGYCTALVHRKK